ncbi:Cof-type HAD-IIB family hydrolase [Mesobacillus subterraneus]|uniref:Cof-type HAD-IIB family hydrolase n=1 Tax=Mesobacillus subterraneus TaxID=285983 RepID=UPI002040D74A|nr:Cof-type HAD-IIB family hydrolase [Mesobacillus subterraneus]MCM3664548.1 Cof-type HAD-IIB family hydrolase [Mesobacillus subterraneus]MCM3683936.1 Cof-type HAD-IIB family hydrolase [Mesobacillus subterraneus]
MIKCIATDMDGTLLTVTQQITPENREAILKAKEKGVEVVVATGRSYQEAKFVLEEAGLKLPMICVNGAEARSEEGEIVSSSPLNKDQARQAALRLVENGVYFEVYTNKGTFTEDEDKAISIIVDIFSTANPEVPIEKIAQAAEERLHKGLVRTIEHYDKLFEDGQSEIYKLLAFSLDDEKLAAANAALREINGLAISSSGSENIEVTSLDAQKGIALEKFLSSRGISMEETMALGDNFNDASMLERVGKPVAMGNAVDQIKELCGEVTLTNEESGVGVAIMKVLED